MKVINLAFLIFLAIIVSCTSMTMASPPALENRTLWPSDEPGVYFYEHEVCAKKFLWHCSRYEWITEKYDLKDPLVWEKFRNMNFVLKKLEMP